MVNDSIYFANLPKTEIAARLLEKVEFYDEYLDSSGLRSLWRRSSDTYYRGLTKSFLDEVGENAEFLSVFIAHYRNIIKHIQIATTSARPTFEPEATNIDYRTRAEVQACSGLLDYYFKDKKFELHLVRSTENALLYGESFIEEIWDGTSGPVVDVEDISYPMDSEPARQALENGVSVPTFKRPVYEGDVAVRILNPVDVIRDVTKESFHDQQWLILRKPRNRWDLVAQYPKHRDEILDVPARRHEGRAEERLSPLRLRTHRSDETEDLDVYVLYHNPTPAVPFGRIVEFLENETVLRDVPMVDVGFTKMPVFREAAGDVEGAPFGYTTAFDLLALVDLVNLLYSTVATNQANFGVQSIQAPTGSSIKSTAIAKGLTLFEYASPNGKLEPLQLTSTPAEIFNFIKMVEQLMETLSGVNSVARGNPEASLKSGAALALVQSQHLEFTKDLQLSYAELVREVGTQLVQLFKANASSPRLAAIAGKAGRTYLKAMSGKDIASINRVTVNMGNQLARTPAGRVNLAEQLVQANMIETPEQFLSVITTGKLEPVTHGRQATLDLIQAENEEMMEGGQPPVLITDAHVLHIQEHAAVGADLMNRRNPAVMEALTAHLLEHIRQLGQLPPELAAFLKQPVTNGPGAAGGPPSGGGTATPPEATEGAALPPGGEAAAGPAAGGQVPFPENPLTGQTWSPADGGAAPV